MPMLNCVVSTLAVASIYYIWRAYQLWFQRHERLLRERVAYLIWTIAQGVE